MALAWHGKFLGQSYPYLGTTITAPLRALLKTDIHFLWAHKHNNTLEKLKALLSASYILQYFDPLVYSVIQVDASQHGLGASYKRANQLLMLHGV